MEIHLFVYFILASLMYFQHALMETTNVSTSDFNFEESRNPNARIKKRELKDYASLDNNVVEKERNGSKPYNSFKEQFSPRFFNSRMQKKHFLHKKLLKKILKPTRHIYTKRLNHKTKQYPIQTLQQQIFSTGNLTTGLSSAKQNHESHTPSLDDYLERGLMSFTNPYVVKSLPNIDGKVFKKNSFVQNSSESTKSKFYTYSKEDKIKPKRFFGGFLSGAVTVLEMAIKVNIPIPFCQFPNSPCKRRMTSVHLHFMPFFR